MKKTLKIAGIGFGILLSIVLIAAAWVQFTPMPVYDVVPPVVQLPTDSASLAKGKKVVELLCAHCHLGDDGKMSGRLFSPASDPFGEIWSANITQHPTKGIGRYTDGELAYLMRTGINRDGRIVGYMMCHPNMSDEDLASIVAYLRSGADIMQPSEAVHPAPAYLSSFMVKALIKFGVFKPLPYDGKPISAPPATEQVAYGRYLATEFYECYTCHSANFETNNLLEPEKSPGYFAGGNPVPDEAFNTCISPNITPSKEHGIGNWTEDQFLVAVKSGTRPDGTLLQHQMPRFATLDDTEVRAIWAYLRTVPPVEESPLLAAKGE
ncbi:MAG: c-type cytochrome [Phaeodactylibacter sp.]|nr:c-type cytochrome [Phaeodactylibacter sp.]MCB9274986.1 c-type cytochrome [Lewinellaceae bacterium]